MWGGGRCWNFIYDSQDRVCLEDGIWVKARRMVMGCEGVWERLSMQRTQPLQRPWSWNLPFVFQLQQESQCNCSRESKMENARRKIREVTRAKSCLAFTLTWEGTEGFFFFFFQRCGMIWPMFGKDNKITAVLRIDSEGGTRTEAERPWRKL